MKTILKRICPRWLKRELQQLRYERYVTCMKKKHASVQPYKKGKYPRGINLICDITAETGLGQSARILAAMIQKAGIPFVILQIDQGGDLLHSENEWSDYIAQEPVYDVNLIHINMNEWPLRYCMIDEEILNNRYNIAYWLWEMEILPKEWISCINTVDEIWAPSEFICKCMRTYTDKQVSCVPYSINLKTPVVYEREHFGMERDVFYYLTMYDDKSIRERKNPDAVIDAFCRAFSPEYANKNKIGLVVKIGHVSKEKDIAWAVRKLDAYQHTKVLLKNYSRAEVEALIANADVLVSLHRSEGYGLPLAEAMYLGTPVIATNWSANTEFMSDRTACMVGYNMVTLKKEIGPYPKGGRWADAHVEDAVSYMQRLYENRDYYFEIQKNAVEYMRRDCSLNQQSKYLKKRFEQT